MIGQENIPRQGTAIIAANHRSYTDPPLMGSSSPRMVHFLAKSELFEFRPFGWLIKNLNAHPIKRGRQDIAGFKAAKEILDNGNILILFPEGRRIDEDAFAPAKAGVGMLATLANCPVIPTYIHNSGYLKYFRPVTVAFGTPLSPKDYGSYQELADQVMVEMAKIKTRIVDGKI